jgi:DNA polymerase III delta prime subunit
MDLFAKNPQQPCLLYGDNGSGLEKIALQIALKCLQTTDENTPLITKIKSIDGKSIGIDQIKELKNALNLSALGDSTITRAILIYDFQKASDDAQNSLLKLLEELPKQTLIILITTDVSSALATILSRCFLLPALPIEPQKVKETYNHDNLDRLIAMSGGRAELLDDLIHGRDSRTEQSVQSAKEFLAKPQHEKIVFVDTIAKDKQTTKDLLAALMIIAHSALQQATHPIQQQKWLQILASCLTCSDSIELGGNSKLQLINLCLYL